MPRFGHNFAEMETIHAIVSQKGALSRIQIDNISPDYSLDLIKNITYIAQI